MDAGNMIKPMLARGELRLIGATTLDEYRKYIEKDAALERRFQQVFVGPALGGGHHRHPARPEGALRGPPRGAHPGRRARRGGGAVGPLRHRPLPPRQGDRPHRRGGQPAADRDRLDADRDRRRHPPHPPARDRAGRPGQGDRRGLGRAPGQPRGGAGRAQRAGQRDDGALAGREGRHRGHPGPEGRARDRARPRPSASSATATWPGRRPSATASCPSSSAGSRRRPRSWPSCRAASAS